MRACSSLLLSAVLSVTAFFVTTGTAQAADEPAPPPPVTGAAAASPVTAEQPKPNDDEDSYRKISLGVNPLGLAIGRYSIQAEYLPAKHHAITLNPFFAHAPVTVTVNGTDVDGGSLNGFGAELGYRYYTGTHGPNGFYIGPSFLFGSYSQSAPSGTQASGSNGSDSFAAYGAALDIGGQAIIGPGIVVGGGFGLQYTKTSQDLDTDNLNLASAIIAGGGIRPRFLLTVAYAF